MYRVSTLHMPQFLNQENKKMAGIKRSSLPVVSFGRNGATEPTVSISENGQMRFNKLALDAMGSPVNLCVADFSDKREMKLTGLGEGQIPKGWTVEDLFPVKMATKGGGGYISSAALMRQVGYDFRASRNQSFKPVVDAAKKSITVSIPKGALQAKPQRARKPNAPKATAQAPVAAAATGGDLDLGI